MKAAAIDAYGAPQLLQYRDVADPAPAAGEVLVRTVAAGVNPVDAMIRGGLTRDYMPVVFPGILGWDIAGIVDAVGEGVSGFTVGDRVMAWAKYAYAERVAVRADLLVHIPDGLGTEEAAALPLAGITGSQLISIGANVARGETILVSGAVGAVGRAAVFTARAKGAHVIAAVRNSQLDAARQTGADELLDLDDREALRRLDPVDVVANTVRGATASSMLGAVRKGGRFVSATGAPEAAPERPDIAVTSFVSRQDIATLAYVAAAVANGRLALPIGLRLPLAQAADAHTALERGGAGKIILIA